MTDLQAVRLTAEAAARKVVQTQATRVWNGTVRSYDAGSNVTSVVLDGDTEPIDAITAGQLSPSTNDRVLVLLAPPSAAYVIGTMTATTVFTETAAPPTTTSDTNGVFTTITVGGVLVDATLPNAPSGLVAVPGAFSDQSYVDISWTANGSPNYQIELARRTSPGVYQVAQQHQTPAHAMRLEGLTPGAVYGVRVCGINRLGNSGAFSAYVDFTAAADTTAPPQVTGVTTARGPSSIIVYWNASTADDVKNGHGLYLVELSLSSTFATTLEAVVVGGTIHSFQGRDTPLTYYVRVAAIDESGNIGPYSSIVSVTAGGITGTMILADAVGATQLGPGAVTPAKVGFTIGGGNLLKNSGFENSLGVSTDWTTVGSIVSSTGRIYPTAARIPVNGSIRQTLTLPAGNYVFSAWVKANALTLSSGYGLYVSGTSAGTLSNLLTASALTTGWARLTIPFTSLGASTTVWIVAEGTGSGTLDADDAQLEVGEVATSYAPKADEILPGTVGNLELAANSVTASKITANTITAAQIAANTITAAQIAANTITATQIAADTITANEIAANAISATELAANAVTAGKIAANAITATNIQSGAITTDKLTVAQTGANMVLNGDFQGATYAQGVHTYPESWGMNDGLNAGTVISTGTGANGVGTAVRLDPATNDFAYVLSRGFPILAGQKYTWSARFLAETTMASGIYAQAFVVPSPGLYTVSGALETLSLISNVGGSAGVWNYAEGKFSPTTSGYLIVRLYVVDTTASSAAAARFDEIYVRQAERSVTIADGAVDAVNITANAITSTKIAADSIISSHIAVNTLTGDRIQTNTLSAAKLTTSTLAATTITLGAGGQFMAGSSVGSGGTGLLINSSGISLYNGATRTIFLDASNGAGTFTGTVNATAGSFSGSITSTATITGGNLVTTGGSIKQIDVFGGYAELTDASLNLKPGSFAVNTPGRIFDTATSSTTGYLTIVPHHASSGSASAKIEMWTGGSARIDVYTPGEAFHCLNNLQVDGSISFFATGITINPSGGYTDMRIPNLFGTNGDLHVTWSPQSGQLFYQVSSEKHKDDIGTLTDTYSLDLIDQIPVIAFKDKPAPGASAKPHRLIGLSAEKTHEIAPFLVVLDGNSEPMSVLYDQVGVLSLAGVKDLRARVSHLEAELAKTKNP